MQPMGGGLDQQINEKVDAYRNNPQALQQRYQQNQQLIDLLALQKLKSEKDAAARDMQMKMQQQPQTIKDQREAELLQRTKDDMVKQTAGVMQQKQAQQQKNMQRAAQGQMPQQRPQMPMAQQAGGLGGLPMPRMAAGGIVAFQEGRGVPAAEYGAYFSDNALRENYETGARVRERIEALGINFDEFQRLPKEKRDRILQTINDKAALARSGRQSTALGGEILDTVNDPLKAVGNLGIAAANSRLGRAIGLSDPENPIQPFEYNTSRKAIQQNIAANLPPRGADGENLTLDKLMGEGSAQIASGAQAPELPTALNMPNARNIPTMADAGNIPADPTGGPMGFNMGEGGTMMPPPPAQAQPKSDTSGIASLKERVMSEMPTGVDASGANSAFQQGLAAADAYTKRDERYSDLARRRDEYEQFMKEEYDPANRRLEGLSEALMAGYGAGGAGAVFSRAGKRMNSFNEGLRMQRAKGMLESFNMTMDMNKTDAELARMGMTTANAFRQDYMANQRAAMSAATQLGVQKLRMLDSEADRILAREKESNSQIYRMATLALEEQQRIDNALKDERLDDRQRIQLGQRGLELFQSVQEGMASLAADRTGLTSLQTQMETAQALQDEDEIARLGPEIEAKQAETIALTTSLINDFGRVRDKDGNLQGTGLYDLIPRMIEMMGGNMSGIDVSDVTSVTTN
jgi:hypothetical protein